MTVRAIGEQLYTLIGARPHTCRDGRIATLEVWRSHCAKCGQVFECTRPAAASKFALNRRCQQHKRPGLPVRRAAR